MWTSGRTQYYAPLDNVHTALQAVVKLALSTTTGKDLSLDDATSVACTNISGRNASRDWSSLSSLAALYASSAVFAGMLFGVGMPY